MKYIQDFIDQCGGKRGKVDKDRMTQILLRAQQDVDEMRQAAESERNQRIACEEELARTKEKLTELQDIVLTSKELARQIVSDAQSEADRLIVEADAESKRIRAESREEASQERQKLLSEIRAYQLRLEEMRRQAEQAKEKLNRIIAEI